MIRQPFSTPRHLAVVLALFLAAVVGYVVPARDAAAQVTANRYSLTIDGFEIASFDEFDTIGQEVTPTDFLQSSDKEVIVKKLPGQVKSAVIVLRRPLNSSLDLASWFDAVRRGQLAQARRSVSLVAYSPAGAAVARFFLVNAWPTKLEMLPSTAGGTTTLIEQVTFAADSIQRVLP